MTSHFRLRYRGPLRVAAIAIGLGAAFFATAGPAAAIDNGTLGIRPASESDFFHISLFPGAAIDATAVISNHTGNPVTLLNYPVDGESTPQGTFALASQSDPRLGVGAWVKLDAEHVTVPAISDRKVAFRLSVPAGTPPGDYAGGLIIESPPVLGKTSTVNGNTAVRLDVIQRQGVRIYLTVAGTATKSLTHGTLSWQKTGNTVTFTLPLRNSGNTILHPSATLDVSGWVGTQSELKFDTPESMLPGAQLQLHARQIKAPPFQAGDATASIRSEARLAHAHVRLIYAPWILLGFGLLALTVVVYALWRGARFIRRARLAIAQLGATAPDLGAPKREAGVGSQRTRHRTVQLGIEATGRRH